MHDSVYRGGNNISFCTIFSLQAWKCPQRSFLSGEQMKASWSKVIFRRGKPLFPPAHSTVSHWTLASGLRIEQPQWSDPFLFTIPEEEDNFIANSTCFGEVCWLLACLQDKVLAVEQKEIHDRAWWEMVFLHDRVQHHIAWASWVATAGWVVVLQAEHPSRSLTWLSCFWFWSKLTQN